MNLYKVKPAVVVDHIKHQSWQMESFFVCAGNMVDATLVAQVEGIRLMHKKNAQLSEYNAKVTAGEIEGRSWMGLTAAPTEIPLLPEFRVGQIKLVYEDIAVDGLLREE